MMSTQKSVSYLKILSINIVTLPDRIKLKDIVTLSDCI